ncbi:MAG: UDP binding domain-containing protein [Candidatus Methanoculleus thermohydrogenotrophicum]|nr:UDP binding domain-containing protein [Candidatus Methanoculleus thermohydrogenotrophicum]
MRSAASQSGIDAEEVFAGVGLDSRIGPAFFRTGIGFGGSCFPKDVRALIAGAGEHGEDLQILHAALRVNEDQPMRLIRLLQQYIRDLSGRRIGILGLAFKPNTDDIRESRAIPIIRALLDAGARGRRLRSPGDGEFCLPLPGDRGTHHQRDRSSGRRSPGHDRVGGIRAARLQRDDRHRQPVRIAAASRTAKIYEGVCW